MLISVNNYKMATEKFVPVRGRVIKRGDKIILLQDAGWTTYVVRITSGYRGTATITEIKGRDAEVLASGKWTHSRGEIAWSLVSARGPVVVTGIRTGCRIDPADEAVTVRYSPDGEMA